MSDNTPVPGWYPSDGVMRYWDGTAWTEHTQPMAGGQAPGVSGAPGPATSGRPSQPKGDRPLWKKKRVIIPAVIVAIIIIAAIAGGGGGDSEDEPTAKDTKAAPKDPGKKDETTKADSKPSKEAEDTADDQPETDDGTKPSMTFPKQNGDWRLDQLQLKNDGLGSFGAVGRITYTGEDSDGGNNIFTVTVFAKDGETILATLTGSANSVKPGQTVTTQFISGDTFKAGNFPSTFQNDL